MTIVDGLVRFDRAADADDVRLVVDPEEEIDDTTIATEHDDSCLQDVADAWWNAQTESLR